MEFEGKIIAVLKRQEGVSKSGKSWAKQQFVIGETTGEYPKKMTFDVFGAERLAQFDIKMGEYMKVFCNIDANEWQGKWFNNVQAWRVDRTVGMANQPTQGATTQGATTQGSSATDADDLPF